MKHLCYFVVLTLAAGSVGCGGGGKSSKTFRIAFVPKIKGIPYFQSCQKGAMQAAEESPN
jgi:ABC-type sugar transport system substrate-binding protein